MKRLIIGLLVVALLCLIAGCDTSITPPSDPSTPDTSQPPEASEPEPEPVFIEVPLEYRELDSFTTQALHDVRGHATIRGYDLPDEIVEWPDFAVYVVVQNLDDVAGTFEIRYICIGTADKSATEKYQWLTQLTPEEERELDIQCYAGNIELYLQPNEIGVAICPQGGVNINSDRVPCWTNGYEVIPSTKLVEQ